MTAQTTKPSAPKKADTQTRNRKLVLFFCALLTFTASCLPALLPAVFLAGFFAGCHKDDGPVDPCHDCPDTTSHNFTFTTYTLGDDGASSTLYDVAIINDTLAYAVGEIYLKDATGQIDQTPYCLAKWNGSTWQLKRLYYKNKDFQGNEYIAALRDIRGVFAFSATDVWLTPGSVFHWNGQDSLTEFSFSRLTLPDPNATVFKLWGENSNNLYGVGNAGTIVFYNGSSWQKIESGTTLDIRDVWGDGNEILALASHGFSPPAGKCLMRIIGTTVEAVSDSGLPPMLSGIWFASGKHYYVVGDGMFEKVDVSSIDPWIGFHTGLTTYYTNAIRGTASNDIVVVGAYGEVLHFNGSTWKSFRAQTALSFGSYSGVALKSNLFMAVGGLNDKGVVIVGRR